MNIFVQQMCIISVTHSMYTSDRSITADLEGNPLNTAASEGNPLNTAALRPAEPGLRDLGRRRVVQPLPDRHRAGRRDLVGYDRDT
jgi:hypothetical protein